MFSMYLNFSVRERQYSVRVHDCVEPVGDGEDGAVSEAGSDRLLNQGIRPEIKDSISWHTNLHNLILDHNSEDIRYFGYGIVTYSQ